AVPTYFFVVSIAVLIVAGAYQYLSGTLAPLDAPVPGDPGTKPLTTLLLPTAFPQRRTAMTRVPARSHGRTARPPPASRSAASTLFSRATLAIVMFAGYTFLAHAYQVIPTATESGVSQLGRAIFGGGTVAYYIVQAAPTLILVLAANTAYADFPRLASIVAR